MSKVPARWDLIGEVAKKREQLAPQTLLVGNGDVESHAQGVELARQYGLDGIMIGRGVFHDPYVFAPKTPWETTHKQARIALYRKQVQLFQDTWQNRERNIKTLNRFCKVYINGFDGASGLRVALMGAESTREILELLNNHAKALPLASFTVDGYHGHMHKTVKALVFDADGTLLDTRQLIMEGYKTVLARHGLEHLANDQYIRQRLGKPVPETYEQIIAGHDTGLSITQLAAEHDVIQDGMVELIKPYSHAEDILVQYKNQGLKLCLFTSGNSAMIKRNFAAAGMPDPYAIFDAVVTADDAMARKPEPDAILELLRRVGVDPRNAAVVGDHAYDMIAAARAHVGLKVGIVHGFGTAHELLSGGATVLAENLQSLHRVVESSPQAATAAE
jgi:HAD superfamily hydrolase (TIGR01549 family)